jgi:hypothetical protein
MSASSAVCREIQKCTDDSKTFANTGDLFAHVPNDKRGPLGLVWDAKVSAGNAGNEDRRYQKN